MPAPLNYYVAGADLPRQIKSHRSWQRGVGGRTVDIVTGLQADMLARIPGWKLVYDEVQITPDENFPLVRAELTLNDPELEITWEVIPTMIELDLLETPVAWALKDEPFDDNTDSDEGTLPSTVLAVIRAVIADPRLLTFEFDWFVDGGGNCSSQAVADLANQLALLGISGMRGVPRYLPCLRLSETVSSRYDQQLSVTFVGAVLSTAALYLAEGVPDDVLFAFPADPVARAGFTWGWLKGAPSIRRTGRGYFAIQQDWQYGEFPNDPVGLFTFIP